MDRNGMVEDNATRQRKNDINYSNHRNRSNHRTRRDDPLPTCDPTYGTRARRNLLTARIRNLQLL